MPRYNQFPRSFAFRLTLEDGERLNAVAAANGLLPGEWARKIVSASIRTDFTRRSVRLRVQNSELLRELLLELRHQGNNLNQIARALNAGEIQSRPDALSTISDIHRETRSLIGAILDALGAGS